METAKDILEKHRRTGAVNIPLEDALRAVKEIADKAWEAGSLWKCVQSINTHKTYPDKSTFMKSLFPETK